MDCIIKLLFAREQIQILHWQTKKFSRHKAYDEFFDNFSSLLDDYVEVYQGRFGRIVFNHLETKLVNLKDLNMTEFVNHMEKCVGELQEAAQGKTDLINIGDEMLALIGKLRYLLTLN